jgi:hypothetical protein
VLLFTAVVVANLLLDANAAGWGVEKDLRELTVNTMQSSPTLMSGISHAFGSAIAESPVVSPESLGFITGKWSVAFGTIQHIVSLMTTDQRTPQPCRMHQPAVGTAVMF